MSRSSRAHGTKSLNRSADPPHEPWSSNRVGSSGAGAPTRPSQPARTTKDLWNHIYINIRNTPGIEQIQQWKWFSRTRANVLIDNALWAPLFTHTHGHTQASHCMHAICTAHVPTLQFFTLQVPRFLNMLSCIWMVMMHSHNRHKRNLTRNHFTTLASQTASAIPITLAPTFVSVSDRRDSERMANTEVRVRVKWITTRVN
jgi:hypothetical protein